MLQLESAAEVERLAERRRVSQTKFAERSGETLVDLVVTDHEPGLGGRINVRLVKRNRSQSLPWNRLRIGSPVVLSSEEQAGNGQHGVVSSRDRNAIEVAVDDWPEGDVFRIDLSADEITRKRHQAALRDAENARARGGELRRVLLGERDPTFRDESELEFNATLDASQQAAIRFAMSAEDVAVIHGPPGTGKTTTLVELICQAVARGEKVLACAPSNTAVDNLLERLLAAKQRVVRIGHPARVPEKLQPFTLDAQVADHEAMKLVKELQRDAQSLFRQVGRYTRAQPARGAKQEMRREARQLKADARLLEQQAVQSVLDRADVVCATLTLDPELLGDRRFDLAVIDEACQSTEPGCWIPVLRAERIVLAGDHCQLPPTILSDEAKQDGFDVSMLERLVNHYGEQVTRRLNVQYRMHDDIMRFSSSQFYDGTLEAHESVASHRLVDLPLIDEVDVVSAPMTFIDTAGSGWEEQLEPHGLSKCNPQEGEFVLKKVEQLREAGVKSREIAIIAPYAAQVRWLRENSDAPLLEIDTVDGFQGREKEAVIISCVRSNGDGEIGFLSDTRRMNVALTRARRCLIVVGDSATLGGHEFYASLIEYFELVGGYRSVWEEPDD